MATLPTHNLTLLDLANRKDAGGITPAIVEILNETNEILEDMVWKEGNLTDGNQTKIRTGIPAPTWRKMYQGVMPTKSTVASVKDTCGIMEAYSEIDKTEADLAENLAEFRLSEDRPHFEGFNQELATALFYANERTEPAKFTGFAPRFSTITGAESGENIIDAGGTGSDNRSVYLVVWGDNTCFGIVPKGIPAGIQHTDKGLQTVNVFNSDNSLQGKMEAYVSHYKQAAGLCVKDWRYVVRIANIDKSLLTKDVSTGADLYDLITQAFELVPNLNAGRAALYAPKSITSMLRRQAIEKVKGSTLTVERLNGKSVVMADQVPVRRCAALEVDEARVV